MRMPISRVFCATIFATSAKIPTALSSRASAAIALRSATSTRCVARAFASRSRILEKPEKGRLGSALASARCICAVNPSTEPAVRTTQLGWNQT